MENLRGSLLMTVAMLGFAIEDMFIKLLSATVPLGMVLILLGVGGAVVFAILALMRGDALFSRDLLARSVLIRNAGELIGTVGFITAIALTPLSSASAILQATPLVVTLGAALFLGEQVGWRRWSAILVGFAGVILIIRPGFDAFEPASLFAVMGVVGLALRDLATRTVPRSISSMQLSTYAFLTLVPAGIGMLAFTGDAPRVLNGLEWLLIAAALAFGVLSYYAIVAAMRMGDVAVITPFRYSRLVFALCFGVLFFGERPDMATLAGSALIVASGIYTFWREARLRRNAARTAKG
ncbi:MAG: DMT family transporter [Rhodobacterales bacterium]|jgi:drug/metabolite transporter (DMT)-like permease|nr:DMT family transporter [Rhodobacterales bacterium]MDX5389747.1 DMT family transporter [Rhodobacterales bacterium]MDX5489444.1 DMT family transporter [Rhodobacterales bacterium]